MKRFALATLVLLLASPVRADIDVGSDGSDGAFSPVSNTVIDLSLAATASWDTPSPVAGQGVLDEDEWAVVFKYSSVNIPAGVTVSFTNHPTRAPVVWLVQGSVTIEGDITLEGANGHSTTQPHTLAEPGPGGFRGGRGRGESAPASGGFGPGGGDRASESGGSYGTLGQGAAAGPTYGNIAILPLVGGSGGSGRGDLAYGGGAGGGAILIAADASITVSVSAEIRASGGNGYQNSVGSGSGGAIRLIADAVSIDGALRATGGTTGNDGGAGRIRVEGNSVTVTDPGDPLLTQDVPGFIFPPAAAPRLRATMLDTEVVPSYPESNLDNPNDVDVTIGTCDPLTLQIAAENIPLGTGVEVRIVSIAGSDPVFTSTPLAGTFESSSATADVNFEPGFSAVQLRAFFDTGRGGKTLGQKLPPALRDLKTLNGERITSVQYAGLMGSGSRIIYVTEKGRKIPVDVR